MSKLIKENEAVYRINSEIITLSAKEINILSTKVNDTKKKRNRICSHQNNNSPLHEMHICLGKNTYIRPAKHFNKSESLSVIEGIAILYFFDDKGKIIDIVELGDYKSGKTFFYRMNCAIFHTLIVLSDYFIFHEVTKGPLRDYDTVMSEWAPSEDNKYEVRKFLSNLIKNKVGDQVFK